MKSNPRMKILWIKTEKHNLDLLNSTPFYWGLCLHVNIKQVPIITVVFLDRAVHLFLSAVQCLTSLKQTTTKKHCIHDETLFWLNPARHLVQQLSRQHLCVTSPWVQRSSDSGMSVRSRGAAGTGTGPPVDAHPRADRLKEGRFSAACPRSSG